MYKIQQIENPDEAMPEDESDEGSDDEVQMAYEKQTFICPLSQGQFKDPVTSIKCKHTFSREAITAYLRGRNADTCPVPGCNRPMVQSDLKPNKSILRQLSRLNFSQVQTQVADDDEYTVVRPSRSKA